ncbi:transposase, partial [Bosea minatitlanensis]
MCRKYGIFAAAFYKFKAKYGGMDVSDAHRLKTLDDENTHLKRLPAAQLLDNAILKDVAAKHGYARCEAEGGGSCLHGACDEPALSVRNDNNQRPARPASGATSSRNQGTPSSRKRVAASSESALPRGEVAGAPARRSQTGLRWCGRIGACRVLRIPLTGIVCFMESRLLWRSAMSRRWRMRIGR